MNAARDHYERLAAEARTDEASSTLPSSEAGDRRRWVLEEIQRDAEADVARFEGQPFTGRTVAEYMGCQAAAIAALAGVVATLLPAEADAVEKVGSALRGDPKDMARGFELAAKLSRVLLDVQYERHRQEAKFPDQHLPDGTGPTTRVWGRRAEERANMARRLVDEHVAAGALTWHDVLDEEYLEALAEDDPIALRAELVQVAAVAVRWIEDIDRRQVSL